jgi:hypothetical protein
MAKGATSKTLIGTAILQVFPGSFIDSDGKTIRIPSNAEGEPLEIKITMTCAKDIVGGQPAITTIDSQPIPQNKEMTEEEIKAVRDLIERLNL